MTTWSGFVNHLRLGVDIWSDPAVHSTTSVNVYSTWTIQCDPSFNFNDNQTLNMSSPQTDAWSFQNTLQANQTIAFTHTMYGVPISYGGGPTYTFAATLNGVYLGAGPSASVSFTVPTRPITTPSATSTNPIWSNITSTTADVSYGYPRDDGGSTVTWSWLQVATDPSFNTLIYGDQQNLWEGRSLTGLLAGTTYYSRVAAGNAAGWGPWSGTTVSSTLAGGHAQVGGSFLNAISYGKVSGTWTQATPWVKQSGTWVQAT